MFKKFTMLLAPLVLVPLGSVLTPLAAHAQSSYNYWTSWRNCSFNFRDYTPVSVKIQVRYSDYAAHAIEVQYGADNSERISKVQIWESRKLDGQPEQPWPYISLNSGNQTTWRSQPFNLTWISTLGTRYVNVKLYNADGRTCTSKRPF